MDRSSDRASMRARPASADARKQGVFEIERLLQSFEAHEGQEKGSLRGYRTILQKCEHPVAGFLLNLIIADEVRHQEVVHSMAATLRGAIEWGDPAAAIPPTLTPEQAAELRQLTSKFIDEEKEGIKEYGKLIESSTGYYRGLFVLLLEVMIHDSEKHVMILEFLRDELANV